MKKQQFTKKNSPQEDIAFLSGLSGVPESEYYKIKAEPTAETCGVCLDMDGRVFLKKQAVPGKNFPPFHPNCRCKAFDAFENQFQPISEKQEKYQKMLRRCYGFTANQGAVIYKAYQLLLREAQRKNLGRQGQIHYVFSNLAALCDNYDGETFRWRVTAGLPKTVDAMRLLVALGMTDYEVEMLYEAINLQHQAAEAYGKDFAHELVQYAIFSDSSWTHNLLDGPIGNLDALGSYKGDVFSARMGTDDMNSDVDANNIYHRASDNEEDFFEIMYTYNMEVENGETNRVDEFLKFYGGGDAKKGLEYIKKDLEDVDLGSYYIGGPGGIPGFVAGVLLDFSHKYDTTESFSRMLENEDAFDDYMDGFNVYSVYEKNPSAKETKDEFIKYLEEGMSR